MKLPPRVTQEYSTGCCPLVAASGDASAATAPFTGEPLPAVPQSTAADVAAAAARARIAQERWAGVPLAERSAVVLRFASLLLKDRSGARRRPVGDRQVPRARRGGAARAAAVAAHYGAGPVVYLAESGGRSGVPGSCAPG